MWPDGHMIARTVAAACVHRNSKFRYNPRILQYFRPRLTKISVGAVCVSVPPWVVAGMVGEYVGAQSGAVEVEIYLSGGYGGMAEHLLDGA